jgi:uncharacterized iron-regulated membrane protein
MGIVSALFVVLLSISGLVLHHSLSLGLDDRFTNSDLLLNWYDIEVPDITLSYTVGEHSVSLIADALYFDSIRVPGVFSTLQGLVGTSFGHLAATDTQLILISEAGELIQGSSNSADDMIYVSTREAALQVNLDTLQWANAEASITNFSAPAKLAGDKTAAIQKDYGASLLSWERFILDIHSGRVLGNMGVFLVDLMAILFVFMALTGVWIWSCRRS